MCIDLIRKKKNKGYNIIKYFKCLLIYFQSYYFYFCLLFPLIHYPKKCALKTGFIGYFSFMRKQVQVYTYI